MPNIKSAKKRVKVNELRRVRNVARKSALRSQTKKCLEAISKKEPSIVETINSTIKAIDRAVAKNILHKNTAARKKSKIMKLVNSANADK